MKSFEGPARVFHPDLLVITGFHMLSAKSSNFRKAQILTAFATYSALTGDRLIPFHVELASMGSQSYWKQLLELILPNTHSIGLNEQELYSAYLWRNRISLF